MGHNLKAQKLDRFKKKNVCVDIIDYSVRKKVIMRSMINITLKKRLLFFSFKPLKGSYSNKG